MSIKIKAPSVWVNPLFTIYQSKDTCGQQNYRLVRESDWRKLMKLVRSAEIPSYFERDSEVYAALKALETKK